MGLWGPDYLSRVSAAAKAKKNPIMEGKAKDHEPVKQYSPSGLRDEAQH